MFILNQPVDFETDTQLWQNFLGIEKEKEVSFMMVFQTFTDIYPILKEKSESSHLNSLTLILDNDVQTTEGVSMANDLNFKEVKLIINVKNPFTIPVTYNFKRRPIYWFSLHLRSVEGSERLFKSLVEYTSTIKMDGLIIKFDKTIQSNISPMIKQLKLKPKEVRVVPPFVSTNEFRETLTKEIKDMAYNGYSIKEYSMSAFFSGL